ncbi:MAG TPA: glycosyltransferase family A protein [Anaerolineales bacterium]|nr:glycosyltransferase family A protein [Anaerolineales bacterium]
MTLAEPRRIQAGLVSVMMPALNAETTIGLAIESLLAQRYGDWELIVVDDGSRDRTAEVVRGYDEARVRLFSQPSRGEAAARNRALEEMHGEFVAFLDSDDRFLPDHLQLALDHLRDHPEHSGVYSDGFHIDPSGHRLSLLSSRRRGPFEGDIFEQVVRASDVFGPPLCMVLRRRPILERRLAYDTRIVIGPDWDFEVKFTESGEFGRLAAPTCEYRLHDSSISITTSDARRRASLAICRENALQRKRFGQCSLDVRAYVFYDLLVNLLPDAPARQEALTRHAEFGALPAEVQARMYRLMAGRAVRLSIETAPVDEWFQRAARLGPYDPRNRWLSWLYRLHPALCRLFLRLRSATAS